MGLGFSLQPLAGEEFSVAARISAGAAEAVVFINGTVLTMDPVTRVEEAIAIRGNRIIRTGSTREVLRYGGPRKTIVDLQGRTLMPGFVDAHSHYLLSAHNIGLDRDAAQELAISYGTTTLAEMTVWESAGDRAVNEAPQRPSTTSIRPLGSPVSLSA